MVGVPVSQGGGKTEARPSSLRSCPHEFGHFWNRIFFNPDSCGRGLSLFDSLGVGGGGGISIVLP